MRTSVPPRVLPVLCTYCMKRNGLSKSKIGKQVERSNGKSCVICEGSLSKLNRLARKVSEGLSGYEFDSFLVGATVSQIMIDREDELRSSLRIRGREGVKTQITRTIGRKVSEITGKKVNYARPDITILVSLTDESIEVIPRSIWVSSRYLKRQRGISQKSKTCVVCSGLGCATCDFKGISMSSIQAVATNHFARMFKAEGCNFIWMGGEDENSLVLGAGRPFFVELVKPRKRNPLSFDRTGTADARQKTKRRRTPTSLPEPEALSSSFENGVEFTGTQILSFKPTNIPAFKVDCEVHLVKVIGADNLSPSMQENGAKNVCVSTLNASELEDKFRDTLVSVRVSRKFKRVTKKIDSVVVSQADDGSEVSLRIKCDGGIPIKKLVQSDDESVVPNLTSYLNGYSVDNSKPFDILEVSPLIGGS
jgi:tRNA U54 and U55 pseudouridine synthase Pus10